MSMYRSAIAVSPGMGAPALMPVVKLPLVKVTHVTQTPHGPVVSGEVVEGTFVPHPDDVGHDEIGAFWKRKKKRGGVAIARKPQPRRVAKGKPKAVKWAKKNKKKARANTKRIAPKHVALPPSAVKAGDKDSSGAPGGPSASPAEGGMLTAQGRDDAAALDAADDAASLSEASPDDGGGEEAEDTNQAADDGGGEDGGDDSSDEGADDSDADVSGVDNMGSEWVGLDEIAGDDDVSGDEWVGADDIAGSAPKRKAKGPNAALVRSRGYTKKRRQPLPFTSASIAAGASAVVSVIPQTLFRGRKLVVAGAIAASFTIDDIKVGNVSQGAAAGSIPADAFGPTTTGEDNMQMDTCPPGMSITLSVTNTSGGALVFRAVIFGDSVQ